MKIVIGGTGKSGTTALTYKLAEPLTDCRILFEPPQRRQALETTPNVVAKIKLRDQQDRALAQTYADYDRRVLLIRDPRDWLISRLFYLWYSRNLPQREFDVFLTALIRKEQQPAAVDFVSLWPPSMPLSRELAAAEASAQLARTLAADGWFTYRYEGLVADRFGALGDYLGFAVAAAAEVAARHRRVVRSKAAGNWRHWLTPRDVEALRPALTRPMTLMGYADEWTLAEPQTLDPPLGSRYVGGLRGGRLTRWYRGGRTWLRQRLSW